MRILNGTDSAVINVDLSRDYIEGSTSISVSYDIINKFRGLFTFFFYVKDAAYRTAAEMVIYGSDITPMKYLCQQCNSTKCGNIPKTSAENKLHLWMAYTLPFLWALVL
jgi:hypothetical protein